FGVIYWSSTDHMHRQIDATVSSELAEIQIAGAGQDLARFAVTVTEFTDRTSDLFYLLQDANGKRLAGNIPALDRPAAGLNAQLRPTTGSGDETGSIRGYGVRRSDGAYLFVGQSTQELRELQELIRHTFEWGFAATLVVAFAGGALMSRSVLGR